MPRSSTTRTCNEPHPQRVHTVRPAAVLCRDTTWKGSAPSGHPQCGQTAPVVLVIGDSFVRNGWWPSRHSQNASESSFTSRLTLWTAP